MHITAEKTLRMFASMFIYVWFGLLIAVILILFVTSQSEQWKNRRKRTFSLLTIPVSIYVVSVLGTYFWFQSTANSFFDGLASQSATRMEIQSDGVTKEIDDPEAIRELLELVRRAPRVASHHSHTEDEYELRFPEIGYTYSLGVDSEVEHEYWLFWDDYPGFKTRVSHIAELRQVRSKKITAWLKRNMSR